MKKCIAVCLTFILLSVGFSSCNRRDQYRDPVGADTSASEVVTIATHVVSDVEFIAREAIMLKKGVISDSGSPYELTQKIEGQVWQTVVAAEEVQAMQEKFRVVNIQNGEQGVILRILSDVKPTEDSVTVVPSLEDYYLYVFGDIL